MYSLDLPYYTKEFNSLVELIDDVIVSGIDPNCYITENGISIGEKAVEHLTY
jgi:3-phosphoglycerate kinase